MTSLFAVESRYDRQERITWWDQTRLGSSHVLVVGAGALGNEIVKNLALLGVGKIDIVDMDRIEHSNLARCALFRDADEGRLKAETLAEAAGEINPEVQIVAFTCRVQELGTAFLRKYDLIICGLDNREARLWVNQSARVLGKYWIDGAIEGLQGLVRVFAPLGACYECTLGDTDRRLLSHRRSCALLAPEAIIEGKTPTNSTSASVVAAIEVQEAVKILVGREDLIALRAAAWRMEGETMLTSIIAYTEDPNCLAHDVAESVTLVPENIASLAGAAAFVGETLNGLVETIYFSDDLLVVDPCQSCSNGKRIVGLRGVLPSGAGQCAQCGGELQVQSQTSLDPGTELAAEDLTTWYWPKLELVSCRIGDSFFHFAVGALND